MLIGFRGLELGYVIIILIWAYKIRTDGYRVRIILY